MGMLEAAVAPTVLDRLIKMIGPILKGGLITVELTLLAIVMGAFLGLILALCRISRNKILNSLAWLYIWFFRGTPMLMQILFIYFGLPMINKNLAIDAFPAAVIALGINSAAYLAEIIRAAIQSIDKGQMEAAKALGMSYNQAMFRIIVPQSYRRLIPPVGNELIMLLKDSSLVSVIGTTELLRTARLQANATGNAVYYIPAAIIYLLLTTVFTIIFQKLEKKYSIYE